MSSERETMAAEIERRLEEKARLVADEKTGDREFTQALLDMCQLNQIRDAMDK